MAKWKSPPKVKIYEAFSVVADKRYELLSETQAKIHSSNSKKTYLIEWAGSYPLYMTANDNGTYWKSYLGYPMVAILMSQGKIKYNPKIAGLFSSIDWNALNKEYNNDYEAAVEYLLDSMKDKIDISAIRNEVDAIHKQITDLSVHRLNKRRTPPR
jgi:hypothetical protein